MNPIRFFTTVILFFSFSILIANDPPANNTYQTATTLTVQPGSCSTPTQGDLTYATNSNNSDYSSSCLFTYASYSELAYADVWYKATVPSSGKLTIETSAVSGSNLSETAIVAYTLSEGVLIEIGCNDIGGAGYFSKVELSGQAENTEIYVMVVSVKQVEGYEGEYLGPFNICAFDPDAPPPPANNTYQTATALTVQPVSCSTQTQGDLTNATNSNDSDYSSSCIWAYGNNPNIPYADVWYKATVPSSGKLTIETSLVSGSVLDNTVIVAYTLSEGVLTEIDCNNEGGAVYFSKIEMSE